MNKYLFVHKGKTVEEWLDYFTIVIPSARNPLELADVVSKLSQLYGEASRYYLTTKMVLGNTNDLYKKQYNEAFKAVQNESKAGIRAMEASARTRVNGVQADIELINSEISFWDTIRDSLRTQIDLTKQACIVYGYNKQLLQNTAF